MSVKGHWQRPRSITREELQMREDYMTGKITLDQFGRMYESLKKRGLIKRNGRVIR